MPPKKRANPSTGDGSASKKSKKAKTAPSATAGGSNDTAAPAPAPRPKSKKKLTKYEQIEVDKLSNEQILRYADQTPAECFVIVPEHQFYDTPYVLASYLGFRNGQEFRDWLTSENVTTLLRDYTNSLENATVKERSTLNATWATMATNNKVYRLTNHEDE